MAKEFHFYCTDYAGAEAKALRKEHLRAHLDYIEANMATVSVAGPMYDESGDGIVGSCVVYRVETLAEARRLFEQDPYYQAGGIWQHVAVRIFRIVAGQWVGGRLW